MLEIYWSWPRSRFSLLSSTIDMEEMMPRYAVVVTAAVAALALPGIAAAQSNAPNLAGTYRCVPQPAPCNWQGANPTITQTGTGIQLNINKDEFAEGRITSNITIGAGPPFNAEGRIQPDQSIEWSNGTKWIKQ